MALALLPMYAVYAVLKSRTSKLLCHRLCCADGLLGLGCSSTLFSTSTTSASSVLRSSDQLHEVVSLSAELLPPLPDVSRIVLEGLPAMAEQGRTPACLCYQWKANG